MLSHELVPCRYCGMPATGVDHVVPRAHRRIMNALEIAYDHRIPDTVPACHQCNSIAGDRVFGSLTEKRAAIHAVLRRKYARLLAAPDWTDEEIAELGPTLRSSVMDARRKRRDVEARLRWPN